MAGLNCVVLTIGSCAPVTEISRRYWRFVDDGFGLGRRSGSELPSGRCARVRKVGAVGAGADGAAEVLVELGMVLTDAGYRLAHGAGHS